VNNDDFLKQDQFLNLPKQDREVIKEFMKYLNGEGTLEYRLKYEGFTYGQMAKVLLNRVDKLYEAIKHGSSEHRKWLKEAIDCHFKDRPMPEYKE